MVKGSDLKVDKKKCIACGACIASYEELFKFDEDGKSEPVADGECEDCEIADVLEICPQNAIRKKS
jgi:ferredoxin